MKVTEKKTVIQINSTCGSGSTGRIVQGLYSTLEQNGYEVMAAYGRYHAPEYMNTYRIGSDLSVNIHGAKSRLSDRHGFYSAKATRRLIEKIRAYDPDIIHLHNIHGYYLNIDILFRYLKTCGKKIIWTLHDCWAFTGHCTHFEYIGCTKWQNGCHHCEQLSEYPKSVFRDGSRKNYAEKKELFTGVPDMTLVTPSKWLSEKVKESFLNEYRVEVIPTGIDLSVFHPVKTDLRERMGIRDKCVLLGVANPWRERKGFLEFKKLADIISDRFQIVMVGLNEEQMRAIPRNVIGIAKTESAEEMVEYYSMADALVDLTFEDTFPTTHLEALACGTPVITYASGGSTEMLDPSCGMSVKKTNMTAMLVALQTLRTDRPFTREACVEKAAQYEQSRRYEEYIRKVYEAGEDEAYREEILPQV